MWKWNLCTLLVGMLNGSAARENRLEVPQKGNIELPDILAIPLGYVLEGF